MHSADAVLVAAADAMADATLKLMTSDQPQLQLQDQSLRPTLAARESSRHWTPIGVDA